MARIRGWKSEKRRVLHAIRISKMVKTRHNWNRVDMPRHIAEDIETIEYRKKVFVIRTKISNEQFLIEMKNTSLRQLDEFERFIHDGGSLVEPKITPAELPFAGTEKESPMQKRKYVRKVKQIKSVVRNAKKTVEITIERRGNHTKITMPKSMDNDTVRLVLQ